MQLNAYSVGAKSLILKYDDGEKCGVKLWSIDTILDLLMKTYQIDAFDKDETMSDTTVVIDGYYTDAISPDDEGFFMRGETISLDLYIERIGFLGIEKMLNYEEAMRQNRLAAKLLYQVRIITNSYENSNS